ncbi:MAG: sigma-70 family RNA polymerase sigma factor [Phycisphaerales bacterium JB037]
MRVAAGDASAVRECLDRFGGLVWSLSRRLLATASEAEDAVQEIFVEIWKSAHRYDPDIASESAFVAMIARRRLIDRQRKAGRTPRHEAISDTREASVELPEASLARDDDAGRAARAFKELSSEQQRVLSLSIHHGLSHEKIATATGLPLGTVKTHARRGLIRLRELMNGPANGGAK